VGEYSLVLELGTQTEYLEGKNEDGLTTGKGVDERVALGSART